MLRRVATAACLDRLTWLLRVGIVALGALLMARGRAVLLQLVTRRALLLHVPTMRVMTTQAGLVFVRGRTLRLVTARAITLHVSGMMGQTLMTIGAGLMPSVVRRRLHLLLMAGAA